MGGGIWRPLAMARGEGWAEGGREGAVERYIVTASLRWSHSHSQTPRDKDVSLRVCEWGCDQHKLAVTVPLSIAPSLHPSLPPLPPTEGAVAATGYLPAPLKRHGDGHWVLPLPPHRRLGGGHRVPPRIPQKVRGRPLGTSLAPHRRCGGGKDIAGVLETYNRTIRTKTRGGGKPGQSEEERGEEGGR